MNKKDMVGIKGIIVGAGTLLLAAVLTNITLGAFGVNLLNPLVSMLGSWGWISMTLGILAVIALLAAIAKVDVLSKVGIKK